MSHQSLQGWKCRKLMFIILFLLFHSSSSIGVDINSFGSNETHPILVAFDDGSFVALSIFELSRMTFYSFNENGTMLNKETLNHQEKIRDFSTTRGITLESNENIFYLIVSYDVVADLSNENDALKIIRVVRTPNHLEFETKDIVLTTTMDLSSGQSIFHPRIAFIKENTISGTEKIVAIWEKKNQQNRYFAESKSYEIIQSDKSINIIRDVATTFLQTAQNSDFDLLPSVAASEEKIFIAFVKNNGFDLYYGIFDDINFNVLKTAIEEEVLLFRVVKLLQVKRKGSFFGLVCSDNNDRTFGLSIDMDTYITDEFDDYDAIYPNFDINGNDGTFIFFYSLNSLSTTLNELEYTIFIKENNYLLDPPNLREQSLNTTINGDFSNLNILLSSTGRLIFLWDQKQGDNSIIKGQINPYCDGLEFN